MRSAFSLYYFVRNKDLPSFFLYPSLSCREQRYTKHSSVVNILTCESRLLPIALKACQQSSINGGKLLRAIAKLGHNNEQENGS